MRWSCHLHGASHRRADTLPRCLSGSGQVNNKRLNRFGAGTGSAGSNKRLNLVGVPSHRPGADLDGLGQLF
jgi:hypothetical protein